MGIGRVRVVRMGIVMVQVVGRAGNCWIAAEVMVLVVVGMAGSCWVVAEVVALVAGIGLGNSTAETYPEVSCMWVGMLGPHLPSTDTIAGTGHGAGRTWSCRNP